MLCHWTEGACAASNILKKRAIAHAQDAFHSPTKKHGSVQKAISGMVYTPRKMLRFHMIQDPKQRGFEAVCSSWFSRNSIFHMPVTNSHTGETHCPG